jgi:hypothetical protein
MSQTLLIDGQEITLVHRGETSVQAGIPYAFTIGAVTIVGTLYLNSPIENSFTDGVFAGTIIGTYHVDKNHIEACSDNGLLRVCIQIDVRGRKLRGRLSTRNWHGGWDDGDWKDIIHW